jgi:hypothetical protein
MLIFLPGKVNSGSVVYYAKINIHSRIRASQASLCFVECQELTENRFYTVCLFAKWLGTSWDSVNPLRKPFPDGGSGSN